MSGEELKACGHCGAAARVSLSIQSDPPLYAVGCSECIIMTEWDADEAVVAAAWNRRHPLPEQPQEGWQPWESAPEDGTVILAFRPDAGVFTAHYVEEDAHLSNAMNPPEGDLPTHWMPLPSPPSTETKESGE